MKTVILVFFAFAALSASAQTDLYLNTKWSATNLDAIRNYVASNISSQYK